MNKVVPLKNLSKIIVTENCGDTVTVIMVPRGSTGSHGNDITRF